MTTSQQWLETAHKCAQAKAELERINSDLKLQVRKLENQIQDFKALEEVCKLEAEKDEIALEEAQHDAYNEEKLEGQTFPSDGCMDDE